MKAVCTYSYVKLFFNQSEHVYILSKLFYNSVLKFVNCFYFWFFMVIVAISGIKIVNFHVSAGVSEASDYL